MTPELENALNQIKPFSIAPIIQTEAFALFEGDSKGVLVRGVEPSNFSLATGLHVEVAAGEIVIGSELAKSLHVEVGQDLALTFGKGNESSGSLPTVRLFRVSGIVSHGIYQKDLRFVYVNRADLAEILNLGKWINLAILSIDDPMKPLESLDVVREKQQEVRGYLDSDFMIRPFWSEYSFLIEAVKVEKVSISIILQLIVVIAVFNIMAFVIFIMEKKAQDFFFLRAVGLSLNQLMKFWLISIFLLWAFACFGAHLLSLLFNWGLANLSFLQIPGEIYVLSSLQIRLGPAAYIIVYLTSLLWVFVSGVFGYWRLRGRPIVQGLRQEFSA